METERQHASISDEVAAVYELIRKFRGYRSGELEESNSDIWQEKLAKIFAVIVVVMIVILSIALNLLPATIWGNSEEQVRLTLQIVVLLIYLLGGITILLQYFSFKSLVSNFTGDFLNTVAKASEQEVALFIALDSLSVESVDYVAKKFDQVTSQLGVIRSFFLGAIEKIGIIPGFIATALAISKVAENSSAPWIEMFSIALFIIYVVMLPFALAAFRFKQYAFVLNQYLENHRAVDE